MIAVEAMAFVRMPCVVHRPKQCCLFSRSAPVIADYSYDSADDAGTVAL